ncbi:hypothetical protein GGX14DRAFT_617909 [Mycena pura]|uniref:Uncharacterized protein n=1 Tax=Mycena pura TaxID=153505 RepID=A0AAD6YJ18_9AGAR|nr:hypothetical protein GGX14DRAFT_617909 [Mycena pura]
MQGWQNPASSSSSSTRPSIFGAFPSPHRTRYFPFFAFRFTSCSPSMLNCTVLGPGAPARPYFRILTDAPLPGVSVFQNAQGQNVALVQWKPVLKRDGTSVVVDSACSPTSGHWVSPYDGVATTLSSDLDTDHLVPLKEVLLLQCLLADVNEMGQRRPVGLAIWRPRRNAKRLRTTSRARSSLLDHGIHPTVAELCFCTYIRAWINVKHFYSLTIDAAEKALETYIDAC